MQTPLSCCYVTDINRGKEMSIDKYTFEEPETKAYIEPGYIELTCPDYCEVDGNEYSSINLYKKDVIALAKHFNVTAED